MTKTDAKTLAKEAVKNGWVLLGFRHYGRGDWGVDCKCPTSGIPVVFYDLTEYRERERLAKEDQGEEAL